MDELISVIVPVYKVEQYLKKCVNSIQNQTYKNLEIILVDDGSPDKCPEICDELAQKDERIKVIHKENGGLSDARNAGINIARGAFVSFIDSDDYIDAYMLQGLHSRICEDQSDIAVCGIEWIDEKSMPIRTVTLSNKVLTPQDFWRYYYRGGFISICAVACNKLYRKSIFLELRYKSGSINEDEVILYDIIQKCNKISFVEGAFYKYLQRSNSIMHTPFSLRRLDVFDTYLKRAEAFYLENENFLVEKSFESAFSVLKNALTHLDLKVSDNKNCIWHKKKMLWDAYKKFGKETFTKKNKVRYNIFFHFQNVYMWERAWGIKLKKIENSLSEKKDIYLSRIERILTLLKYPIRIARSKFILLYTPEHGNLGDHAITLSEYQMLKKVLPGSKYCEVTAKKISSLEYAYALLVPRTKTVLIQGGGSLGSLWPMDEVRFRRILKAFHKNKIIVFPQTVSFSTESQKELDFLKDSQDIYSEHPDLTIFVREKQSYEFMQEYFPKVKSVLVPDAVMALQSPKYDAVRKGVLLCLRSDREKEMTEFERNFLLECLHKKFAEDEIEFATTVLAHGVKIRNRNLEVEKKLKEFAEAKLVVTDRLHGMVFAALTGTPCVAVGNCNGKVKGVYEWIKELPYVVYLDNILKIEEALDEINLEKSYTYEYGLVECKFELLFEQLKNIDKRGIEKDGEKFSNS